MRPKSLDAAGSDRKSKILDFEQLKDLRKRFPSKKIVHCHGVFDLLHPGHLKYFESAKKFGDLLVVTLTADQFVNKGPGRPHFTINVRLEMVAALELVDFVCVSGFANAVSVISALKPHFYVKGPDYRNMAKDSTGGIYLEEKAVKQGGGELVFTDDEIHSSSTLINRYFRNWSTEQQATIDAVKAAGGYAVIEEVLDKISNEKVLVVGEPIVDTYVFCMPEAISSKGSAISAKFLYEENYAGGILAIANHLSDFVKETTLLTTHGGERYFKNLLEEKLDKRVKLVAQEIPGVLTPRKTRFIGNDKIQRLFEITNTGFDQWKYHSPTEFCELLKTETKKATCNVVADFGHGLFEADVLTAVSGLRGFTGLNVQTNSSNFGFNLFTKHKKFSYLSIDTKEARLASHDRSTPPIELIQRIRKEHAHLGAAMAMTLGPLGSFFGPKAPELSFTAPAFDDGVVDPVGAGDAFFGLTSLLVKVGCPDVMIPFIGNVFAGLKTKIVGNKSSVSRSQLMKAIAAILK